MGLNIPILSMLRTRLEWAQERQRLLAANVANADTPNFKPSDLAPLRFPAPDAVTASALPQVTLARTEPGHIPGIGDAAGGFHASTTRDFGVHPTGNAVNLEQEMMKVAANTMDYQAATALYTRSLNLLKTALGR